MEKVFSVPSVMNTNTRMLEYGMYGTVEGGAMLRLPPAQTLKNIRQPHCLVMERVALHANQVRLNIHQLSFTQMIKKI